MNAVRLMLLTAVVAASAAIGALTGQATTADSPCEPQNAHQPSVGNLQDIVAGRVYQGKNILTDTTAPLLTNGTLCTTPSGDVRFMVTPLKPTTCEMYGDARLRLYPPRLNPSYKLIVIRFEQSTTYCGTGSSGDTPVKYDADRGKIRLVVKDPLFSVGVNPENTVVKVATGYIQVSTQAAGSEVIVGPGQQVVVPEDQPPTPVAPSTLTQQERLRFARLTSVVPVPSFDRPDATGSPTLARIFQRHRLIVGIDPESPKDPRVLTFVKQYVAFLAKSWHLALTTQFLTTAAMIKNLTGHAIDIGISSAAIVAGFTQLPLVVTPKNLIDSTFETPDAVFEQALGAFLRAAVTRDVYGQIYRTAFQSQPNYEPLQAILIG